MFGKNGVLRNFTKFTRKHLCQSLFVNKVTGLRFTTLLKKRLYHRSFPVNFAKFLRTPFVHRTPPVAASVSIRCLCCKCSDIWPPVLSTVLCLLITPSFQLRNFLLIDVPFFKKKNLASNKFLGYWIWRFSRLNIKRDVKIPIKPIRSVLPAGIYLFNVRTIREICSNLRTIKTPEQRQWRRSDDFVVIFEQHS